MKILIADKLPEQHQDQLRELGHEIVFEPSLTADQIPEKIGSSDVLIVRSTKVTQAALEAGTALQLVIRAGAGTNTIDLKTASAKGIFVANCPGKNAIAVAELTIGMMLAVDRRIPTATADLKSGKWNKKEFSKADGIYGKTLGIVGLGNIGQEVAVRAKALGMDVMAWSRSLTGEQASKLGIQRAPTLQELACKSDVISVHLPKSDGTKNILGTEFFQATKERAVIINVARDGIVDEEALAHVMESKGIRYATDVFDGEPGSGEADFDHMLAKHHATVCTPHIGASTTQAQNAVAREAVRIIDAFTTTGDVPNCVNLTTKSPASWQLNVRHMDKVGVLASVLSSVREAGINVEEVENVIFDGGAARCARIRLSAEPTEDLIDKVQKLDRIIDARAVSL